MYIHIYQPSFFMPGKYERVFAGEVACEDKDELAVIFCKGTKDPRATGYHGAGLQSNNLIEIIERGEKNLYRVEVCDWSDGCLVPHDKEVDFTATPNVQDTIMGVFAERGKFAAVQRMSIKDIVNKICGGYANEFEAVALGNDICCIVGTQSMRHINSEMFDEMNRTIYPSCSDDDVLGICRGPIFFCSIRQTEDCEHIKLCDLSQYHAGELQRKYRLPERFFALNGEIRSIPYYPNISIIKG
jgi:hypothetical protein